MRNKSTQCWKEKTLSGITTSSPSQFERSILINVKATVIYYYITRKFLLFFVFQSTAYHLKNV
jgi:hypothetical protein